MPLRLTDDELPAVFQAARPLPLHGRDGFLKHVANELSTCAEVGPGSVHRACAKAQRLFFSPPDLSHGDCSKYR
jgi:hypothetical protein